MSIRTPARVLFPDRCNLTRWRTAALLALCWASLTFAAEEFPARPVRMLIPFPAGGPADYVGRLFALNLTDLWGKQVVADNRPGASGSRPRVPEMLMTRP